MHSGLTTARCADAKLVRIEVRCHFINPESVGTLRSQPLWQLVSWFIWCSCFMNSCSDFLHTFCVLSMFSEPERLRVTAGRPCQPCYNHVIGTWSSHQLICSVVFRYQLDVRESVRLVLSQQLAGIRFTIWTSKSESVVKSTNVVESTVMRPS